MVLLRADPLQDIANTRAIEGVIVDGRSLGRAQLDAMLAAVEAANEASRANALSREGAGLPERMEMDASLATPAPPRAAAR
jgi:hypothetical protein